MINLNKVKMNLVKINKFANLKAEVDKAFMKLKATNGSGSKAAMKLQKNWIELRTAYLGAIND